MTVVSGITTQDAVFAHFAYSELAELASDESSAGNARRIALFGDQKYSPSLWNVVARQSLLRLGQDYQTFLRRGAPITPPAIVAPTIPKPKDPPSTPLIRKAIFRAPRQSPLSSMLDSVSSDSELSKAAEAVAGEMEERASQMHIPELFRSVAPSSAAVPSANAVVAKPTSSIISSFIAQAESHSRGLVVGYCPVWLKESAMRWNKWFYRERLNKAVEVCLPNRELDALIIEGAADFYTLYAAIELGNSAIALRLYFPERRSVWCGSKGHTTHHRSFPLVSICNRRVSDRGEREVHTTDAR